MSIIILSLTKCTKMVGIFINFASLLMYVWKTVLNFVGLFSLWNKVIFLLKGYNEYGGWACLEAILVEKFHHVCKEMVWIFFFLKEKKTYFAIKYQFVPEFERIIEDKIWGMAESCWILRGMNSFFFFCLFHNTWICKDVIINCVKFLAKFTIFAELIYEKFKNKKGPHDNFPIK